MALTSDYWKQFCWNLISGSCGRGWDGRMGREWKRQWREGSRHAGDGTEDFERISTEWNTIPRWFPEDVRGQHWLQAAHEKAFRSQLRLFLRNSEQKLVETFLPDTWGDPEDGGRDAHGEPGRGGDDDPPQHHPPHSAQTPRPAWWRRHHDLRQVSQTWFFPLHKYEAFHKMKNWKWVFIKRKYSLEKFPNNINDFFEILSPKPVDKTSLKTHHRSQQKKLFKTHHIETKINVTGNVFIREGQVQGHTSASLFLPRIFIN